MHIRRHKTSRLQKEKGERMDLADFEKEHAEEIETEFMRRLSETEGMVQALITLNPELYREVLMDLASEYGVRD